MSAPQTTMSDSSGTKGVWPADVVAFAATNGAEHCLQPMLEATQRIFPTANFVKVSVEEDPELRDNTQIVFHVQVAGLSYEQWKAASEEWGREHFRICPPLRAILFGLCLERKDRADEPVFPDTALRRVSATDVVSMLRTRPFRPFLLCMSDGKLHKVHQPDMVIVTPITAVVGYPSVYRPGIAVRFDVVSLRNVVRVGFTKVDTKAAP
ncbi:MAG TPA: hypothetical protein VH575_23195 [Gemmataceae bacterium]|jgi:hypothetical protein